MPNSDSNVVREGVFHKAFAVAGKALGQCFISLSRRRRGGRAVLFQHNILNTHKSKHIKRHTTHPRKHHKAVGGDVHEGTC